MIQFDLIKLISKDLLRLEFMSFNVLERINGRSKEDQYRNRISKKINRRKSEK